MNDNLFKSLYEAMTADVSTPSQTTFMNCINSIGKFNQHSIKESVVDSAFEGYKNKWHSFLSISPNFQNEWLRETEKQSVAAYWDKKKELYKNLLREYGLLM